MKLPDIIIERLIQRADSESDAKMETTREMGVIWEEIKLAIADEYAAENKLDTPDMGKTRTWYIESVCASVAKIAHSSGYNRMRVWDQVLSRGLDKKYDEGEVLSFTDYLWLLRNLKKGEDGLVPEDKFKERVDWYFAEFEEYGKPPGTRDIEKHAKNNGDKKEWEQLLKKIIRNVEQLLKLEETPKELKKIVEPFLSTVAAFCIGGEQKKQKNVSTVDTSHE